jgi:hypothetical protein
MGWIQMKNSGILILGLLGILVLVVAVSGCTSTTSTQKTFSDGVIRFNYTDDFQNSSVPVFSGSGWQHIIFLNNSNNIHISVKNSPTATSAATARNSDVLSVKAMSTGEVLSTTTETNPNGLIVEKDVVKLTLPNTNSVLRYYDMFFSVNNVVYEIDVYGDDSKYQQIKKAADLVFNTLKVS